MASSVAGPGLELRELRKHYRSGDEVVRAVDGVSLSVAAGELVVVLGPSGSGKTTLLLLAGGIETPDAGEVAFGGSVVTDMTSPEATLYRRRQLGFVFQSFHLQPGLRAVDNAAVKLVADGVSPRAARNRVVPLLERVGLERRMEQLPERLSGGERQRVAIARALAHDPKLVLADEPTGNLDSARTEEILRLLSQMCRERDVACLLVTHDERAIAIADRAFTLTDGRLRERSAAEVPRRAFDSLAR